MTNTATLELDGKIYSLPVVTGTENEKAIDISNLREMTGYVTLDSGFKNTGSTKSAITFIDGDKGILHYRGYPIEEIVQKSTFLETAYLLIYGDFPNSVQYKAFTEGIKNVTMIHENMKGIFDSFSFQTHPMTIVSTLVSALSGFYREDETGQTNLTISRLLGKLPTIASWAYKHTQGDPLMYPKSDLEYCDNLQYMMFATPKKEYEINPLISDVLDKLLILHADHEQNCSTSTVRLVGSSRVNLFSTVSAGISALWGPLHGGANQEVVEMLEQINMEGGKISKWIDRAKDKNDSFRLMGFGHRVYKNFDPRAKIIKKMCDDLLKELKTKDPILDIAKSLENIALNDSYFIEKKLYPNVDFYSGIIYKALGIPKDMFTVMFALGRLPGWIAQWKEMIGNNDPIGRPRQIYIGNTNSVYIPIEKR